MLPTFSCSAHPSQNTNTFVALYETLNARSPERAQKVRPSKRKCLRMGLEMRQVSALDSIGGAEVRVSKKPSRTHCIRPESGVRYQSAGKSKEFCCDRRYCHESS
jgi:hypothetical protein